PRGAGRDRGVDAEPRAGGDEELVLDDDHRAGRHVCDAEGPSHEAALGRWNRQSPCLLSAELAAGVPISGRGGSVAGGESDRLQDERAGDQPPLRSRPHPGRRSPGLLVAAGPPRASEDARLARCRRRPLTIDSVPNENWGYLPAVRGHDLRVDLRAAALT